MYNLYNTESLHSVKIGVWVAMSRRKIVASMVFVKTTNAPKIPKIHSWSIHKATGYFFQQDSVPAHTARTAIN
jgi:hypothetical protein